MQKGTDNARTVCGGVCYVFPQLTLTTLSKGELFKTFDAPNRKHKDGLEIKPATLDLQPFERLILTFMDFDISRYL